MTPTRRAVLDILARADRPLGAYEILARLDAARHRKRAPTTAYRALEFLMNQGLVARVESRNAYVTCALPRQACRSVVLICDQCDRSTLVENLAIEPLLEHEAGRLGFQIRQSVLELQGLCARCRSTGTEAWA